MNEEVKRYLEFVSFGLTDASKVIYRRVIYNFADHAAVAPADLRVEHLRAYMQHLIDLRLASTHIKRQMVHIMRFVRWLEHSNIIPDGQVNLRLLPRVPKQHRAGRKAMTRDDYLRVYHIASHHRRYPPCYASALLIAWNTGLRISDVALLKWPQVNFGDRLLTVSPLKTRRYGQRLEIPVTQELYDHLVPLYQSRVRNDSPINPILHSLYQTDSEAMTKIFRRLFDAAGLSTLSFHCSRHGFVTNLINNNVNPVLIGSITGQSLQTVLGYCHPTLKAKRDAMNLVHSTPL